jgi:Tol biopolymer transport system component
MQGVRNDLEQLAEDSGRAQITVSQRGFKWWWGAGAAGLLLGMVWIGFTWTQEPAAPSLPERSVLTSFSGSEEAPSFSPDGNYITFSWDGPTEDNRDIYVQMIESREVVRRTTDPASDSLPNWSPDGRYISFIRDDGESARLMLIPSHGGAERVLATAPSGSQGSLRFADSDWSPDSQWLAVMLPSADEAAGLERLFIDSGERKPLTQPPKGHRDVEPSISPDGDAVVFIRMAGGADRDLYWLRLSEDGEPSAEPKRLTFLRDRLSSPTWTADGRRILYSREGHLWQVDPEDPDESRKILAWGGNPDAFPRFALSPTAGRIVFEQSTLVANIYRIDRSEEGAFGEPIEIVASNSLDSTPEIQPGGQKIAMMSTRSGFEAIWICDADGANPFQLVSFSGAPGGAPSWSPDGTEIAYDSWEDGPHSIYVIPALGGQARKLTDDSAKDGVPAWSRDGKWIYFGSDREGVERRMWKIPAEGGEPTPVTQDEAFRPIESYDGKFLYFWRNGIWRIPVEGGKEEFLLESRLTPWSFAVVEEGIYFLGMTTDTRSAPLNYYSFASGMTAKVIEVPRPGRGIAATRDGNTVLYTRETQWGTDLMLVENFR